LATPLREIDAPASPDVDAKLRDTFAHRFHVAKKFSFKPLDPSEHNAADRRVCQMVEPGRELRERLDVEHQHIVIDRLQCLKRALSDPRPREILSEAGRHDDGLLASNPAAFRERPLMAPMAAMDRQPAGDRTR
jgi:hypothetical protein